MKCSLIDIWTVYQGGDDRHPGTPSLFFTKHTDAINASRGSGWYGGDAHMSPRKAIVMDDGKVFLVDLQGQIDLDNKIGERVEAIKKKALDKLTDYEKEVLGLS